MNEKMLREHLQNFLSGKGAHLDYKTAFAGLPPALRGVRPEGAPHSAWELLEHMRIAQWDILEFSRNPQHKSPKWPEGYWPRSAGPPRAAAWSKSIRDYRRDRESMKKLVLNPRTDLLAKIAW